MIDPRDLPAESMLSAINLAELSAGVQMASASGGFDPIELGRRIEVLQRVEHEFEPIPFDASAARIFGRVSAAVAGTGRVSRARTADLMIASVAIAEGLPLYTTNADDFVGLEGLLEVVPVVPRVHQGEGL
ncbi:MAG: type II toxin-antitoxin system VapC family toxin [Sporichthyaceae bacterium]